MMVENQNGAIVADLFDRYYRRVFGFARQLTDPHTAEDVAQEVFLRLMNVEDLPSRTISVSYLIKVAHNLIRGQGRSRAAESTATDAASRLPQHAGDSDDQELSLPVDQIVAAAERSLDKLSSNEQLAVRLTVCYGLSLKEASESLGVRISTVTNWKYRGLRKMSQNAGHAA